MKATMNAGCSAVTLIDCMALIASALLRRSSAGMTNAEKAKNVPPTSAAPTAAAIVGTWTAVEVAAWAVVVGMGSMLKRHRETVHGQDSPIHARASTIVAMDSVAGLLDGPRARGAFLL